MITLPFLIICASAILLAVFLTLCAFMVNPKEKYLCDSCQYNTPESCHKAERPQAMICKAYAAKEYLEICATTTDIATAPVQERNPSIGP